MKIGAWVLIALSCFAFVLSGYKLFLCFTHPIKFEEEIKYYANEYEIPTNIVASLINVESSYKESAKSSKNAIGLMQIKLDTANYLNELYGFEEISETELFNYKTNIKYGCMYLNYLNKKFNNIYTTLAAYNAGETRVRSWLNSGIYSLDGKTLSYIPYEETRNYVEKINNNIKFYKQIYN